MNVAQIIFSQLGGNRFAAITGAHTFMDLGNGLGMKIRRNKSGAQYLRIKLTPMDTYTMEFIRFRKMDMSVVKSYENIYADQLQDIFTSVTGYYTTL